MAFALTIECIKKLGTGLAHANTFKDSKQSALARKQSTALHWIAAIAAPEHAARPHQRMVALIRAHSQNFFHLLCCRNSARTSTLKRLVSVS